MSDPIANYQAEQRAETGYDSGFNPLSWLGEWLSANPWIAIPLMIAIISLFIWARYIAD